jgi:tetratricopeptide (TPR) repeat protein
MNIRALVSALAVLAFAPPLSPYYPRQSSDGMPRGVYYPPGTYDYGGFAEWGDLGPISSECSRALQLIRKRQWAQALGILRTYRKKHPDDPTAIQGITICCCWLDKLPAWLDEIALEGKDAGVDVSKPPPYLALAFQYAFSVAASEANQGRRPKFNIADGKRPLGYYGSYLRDFQDASALRDKVSRLMLLSAVKDVDGIVKTRRYAREILAKDPRFYQVRAILAASLLEGIVATIRGNGPWVPATEEQKSNPAEALKQIQRVIAEHPNYVQAYYVAGTAARSSSKDLAIKYYRFFADKTQDSARKSAALKEIDRLSGKS